MPEHQRRSQTWTSPTASTWTPNKCFPSSRNSNLFRFTDLQYLYLLFNTCAPESVLLDCVASMRRILPLLKCLHVHYRCELGSPMRDSVTWIRRQSGGVGEDLIKSGPCFQSCSTATFIGLAKPLNRDFQPML
ncbi:hypothetical protein MRX96_011915 [Rhipicephalus microplus]